MKRQSTNTETKRPIKQDDSEKGRQERKVILKPDNKGNIAGVAEGITMKSKWELNSETKSHHVTEH